MIRAAIGQPYGAASEAARRIPVAVGVCIRIRTKEWEMRKRLSVVLLLTSVLTFAAPALASTTERSTTFTTVVERPGANADSAAELRRFCSANPEHDRCPSPDVVNVRQMIWRLIKAGEWRHLFHLLQRLGII
jgi:hypothetical protein